MITELERKRIIDLIHQEVVPAIGCTEPIAVALCVAKATETLGMKPEKINVLLSANILKNAMGVGIPGTGMIGLPIAIALGALIGKSDYQLEVLKDSTPDAVEEGKRFIEEKRIHISLKENIEEKLYIEICCEAGDNRATAVIAGGHTTFIYIAPCQKESCPQKCGAVKCIPAPPDPPSRCGSSPSLSSGQCTWRWYDCRPARLSPGNFG